MTLADRISALATRVGQELKALKTGKADDSAVLHLSGNETKTGTLTFGSSPIVPTPTAPGHPVRRDDGRFVPAGGASGQVLTKTSVTDHALEWADPASGGAGGTYVTGTVPAGAATVTVTHGLGTRDVVVMVRETASYQYVPVANDAPDGVSVRLSFATTPGVGQYRYVIFAALGAPVAPPAAPTAHAATHATGGTDSVSPASIGAAESSHTHPASAVTSGTLSVARLPTGTTSSTVAIGNHTHSGYASVQHADRHATGGTDEMTPASIGAASATHTHPAALVGPWTKTSGFSSSGVAPPPTRVGGSVTVPALGFDWRPLASARLQARCDLYQSIPELHLKLDDSTDEVVAVGIGEDRGRDQWKPINCAAVVTPTVLSGSTSHTFYLVTGNNLFGGSWVEINNEGNPHITVYAIPA